MIALSEMSAKLDNAMVWIVIVFESMLFSECPGSVHRSLAAGTPEFHQYLLGVFDQLPVGAANRLFQLFLSEHKPGPPFNQECTGGLQVGNGNPHVNVKSPVSQLSGVSAIEALSPSDHAAAG